MTFDRKTALRELGDLHRARSRTILALKRIRSRGVPNGCNLLARLDAVRNLDRQIELRRAAIYA